MYEQFKDILGLSPEENKRAVEEGYRALDVFNNVTMRGAAREVLEQLEREDRLGVVLLGRPYHNDPGVNHEILEEFQKLGYPVFAQDCLPIDDDIIWRLFGDEVEAGEIPHPMSITDVWKNSYSENTSRKVWAAKYVARHPNLVALELSSFKCGHDAPIYTRGGRDRGALRHAVLLLQGHRREQAHRFDQDPRGDHRLLPEALSRRHGAQQAEGQHASSSSCRSSKRACAAQMLREKLDAHVGRLRNRLDAADPREPGRAGRQQTAGARVRSGAGRLTDRRKRAMCDAWRLGAAAWPPCPFDCLANCGILCPPSYSQAFTFRFRAHAAVPRR